MFNSLLKFVVPLSFGNISVGSLITYASFNLIINNEEDIVKNIINEKDIVKKKIKYDEKYQEIIEKSDYFYNQTYHSYNITEDEKFAIKEIEKLYLEYDQIITNFKDIVKNSNNTAYVVEHDVSNKNYGHYLDTSQYHDKNLSNPKNSSIFELLFLMKNWSNNFAQFVVNFIWQVNPLEEKTINNFDIIAETKQWSNSKWSFYSFKFNYSDKLLTIWGSKEFVNNLGNKIKDANEKLFNKVLEYKLKNKSLIEQQIQKLYETEKQYMYYYHEHTYS